MLAILATIGILAIVIGALAGVLVPLLYQKMAPAPVQAGPSTTAVAPVIGRPIAVRPVIEVRGTAPEACMTVGPVAPAEPLSACNIEKTAMFSLGPVALELNVTAAEVYPAPAENGTLAVRVDLTPESSEAFGDYTATQVGKQVALLHDAVVLSAPSISREIRGGSLLLSGEFTPEQADDLARMLRDDGR